MYTKTDIINGLAAIGVKPEDTLLVHSSMKAIGEVTGGAETVLDALIEYMQQGLLIFLLIPGNRLMRNITCIIQRQSHPA